VVSVQDESSDGPLESDGSLFDGSLFDGSLFDGSLFDGSLESEFPPPEPEFPPPEFPPPLLEACAMLIVVNAGAEYATTAPAPRSPSRESARRRETVFLVSSDILTLFVVM